MRVIYERSLRDYINEIDREDVRERAQRIIDEGKGEEFEAFIGGELVDDKQLCDLFTHYWESVYKHLGIPYDDEGIDDDDY